MFASARLRLTLAAPVVLVTAACSDTRPTAPERPSPGGANIGALPTAAGAQVLDADDVGGAEHFHWLPPIEAAIVGGPFDGALNPSIRICRLPNTGCTTPLVQFTRASSPAIVVNATAQSYSVSWSTKPSNITLGDYRAEVWIATRRLGFADVRVAASAKDLKNVPSGFAGVQTGKAIVLAFRLEQGIIASVSVTPEKPRIDSAYTQQLTATVKDFRGDPIPGVPVTWASALPAIATVSTTGEVKGITLGTTIITATTAAGISGIDTIEVVRPAIAQIVVNPSGAEVAVGDTTRVWATAFDGRGGILPRQVTYSSSNTAVATVSQSGLVTGMAVGTVTITATAEGITGSTDVVVTPPPVVPVARVDVSPFLVQLQVGGTTPLTVTTYDANNNVLAGRPVAWTTSDEAVATVAPSGVVTATGPGYQRITATSADGPSNSVLVEVTGATVSCVRPLALPALWFMAGIPGSMAFAKYGATFGTVPPATISGEYYPIRLDPFDASSSAYRNNLMNCPAVGLTLGAATQIQTGNQVGTTVEALDTLFARDPNATWDPAANGGQGGVVNSTAPAGTESARVIQVPLFETSDNAGFGSSSIRFRRTAFVFIESYVRARVDESGAKAGDIVFRFVRFGQ